VFSHGDKDDGKECQDDGGLHDEHLAAFVIMLGTISCDSESSVSDVSSSASGMMDAWRCNSQCVAED
jgi:hypothetical protein